MCANPPLLKHTHYASERHALTKRRWINHLKYRIDSETILSEWRDGSHCQWLHRPNQMMATKKTRRNRKWASAVQCFGLLFLNARTTIKQIESIKYSKLSHADDFVVCVRVCVYTEHAPIHLRFYCFVEIWLWT